jgi:hypothetical protein
VLKVWWAVSEVPAMPAPDRAISSWTIAASSTPYPWPPNSSGMVSPHQPPSANAEELRGVLVVRVPVLPVLVAELLTQLADPGPDRPLLLREFEVHGTHCGGASAKDDARRGSRPGAHSA